MRLEFELEVANNNYKTIIYKVKRKGIVIGVMALESPYTHSDAEKKLMTMHNTLIRDE